VSRSMTMSPASPSSSRTDMVSESELLSSQPQAHAISGAWNCRPVVFLSLFYLTDPNSS
jgi:hypothetical protein